MSLVKKLHIACPAILAFSSQLAGAGDLGAEISTTAAAKIPPIKTVTNFSQSLRCMDELFLAFGKQGIVITSTGIPDETGKVRTGTKEMVITAIAKMTLKSEAFEFIDFHSGGDDLGQLFAAKGDASRKMPDYYIRGSITQMDDNAVRKNKGGGFSLPFLDFGVSKDDAYDLISMDMSIGDVATRRILPISSTSNTLILSKTGRSGEAGGKIGKVGLSFNLDLSQSEGVGAATRTLVELGLIEALGKFTQVPYWRCLDASITNPVIREQAREGFDSLKEKDKILFVQRKLGGGLRRYAGPIDGIMNNDLRNAIAEYQAAVGLIADGTANFETYASLLDDVQNQLAALPATPSATSYAGRPTPAPIPSAPQPPVVATAPAQTIAPSPIPPQAQGSSGTQQSGFRMTLSTERGNRPSFKTGEFLNMNLSLHGDGTVYCYYEDTTRTTARIFPNQFQPNSAMRAGSTVSLPSGGFKIRFDQPGREKVACIGSERELVVPSGLRGARDLTPLAAKSVDDIISQFKQNNSDVMTSMLEITVTR